MRLPKKQVNMRLSEETLKELDDIAKRQRVTQTDVITVLVHLYNVGNELETADEWFDIIRMS